MCLCVQSRQEKCGTGVSVVESATDTRTMLAVVVYGWGSKRTQGELLARAWFALRTARIMILRVEVLLTLVMFVQ